MTKPLPPHLRREKRTFTNYEAMVGTDLGEWRITGKSHNGRAPMFDLRCLAKDHEHSSPAWNVVHRDPGCPYCKGGRAASRAGRVHGERVPLKRLNDAPEVCACTFYDGRLVRPCQQHRGAA